MTDSNPAETMVDERIEELYDLFDPPRLPGPEDTLPGRQILIVENAVLFAASWVPQRGATALSGPSIRVKGCHSPSSVIQQGFIHFVSGEAPKRPHWDDSRKWLRLWMDVNTLPIVLRQLQMRDRVMWCGEFDNGHLYGELYAQD